MRGKAPGAWNLAPDANESRLGFLLNHVIKEELPTPEGIVSNSDPVTGQGAWFDLRVAIRKTDAQDQQSAPQFQPLDFADAGTQPLRYGAGIRKGTTR